MELLPKSHWKDTILGLLLIYYRWSYRWPVVYSSISTGDHRVGIIKAADATSVVHRWDSGGSSVTTGGLWLVSNPVQHEEISLLCFFHQF